MPVFIYHFSWPLAYSSDFKAIRNQQALLKCREIFTNEDVPIFQEHSDGYFSPVKMCGPDQHS